LIKEEKREFNKFEKLNSREKEKEKSASVSKGKIEGNQHART